MQVICQGKELYVSFGFMGSGGMRVFLKSPPGEKKCEFFGVEISFSPSKFALFQENGAAVEGIVPGSPCLSVWQKGVTSPTDIYIRDGLWAVEQRGEAPCRGKILQISGGSVSLFEGDATGGQPVCQISKVDLISC